MFSIVFVVSQVKRAGEAPPEELEEDEALCDVVVTDPVVDTVGVVVAVDPDAVREVDEVSEEGGVEEEVLPGWFDMLRAA